MTAASRPPPDKKPWSKTSPSLPWDDIVIGSGMGGMTTAALLSQLGRRVLVLEQHYVPGGFTHTFRRPHYHWDVGVHAVGEVTRRSMTGRLLERLTGGKLEWASLGPVYDEFYFPDDVHIDFPDSPAAFRDHLCAAFPAEQRAIDQYLHEIRRVAQGMRRYYLARLLPERYATLADHVLARRAQRYFEMTTERVLERLTSNRRLRTLFAAQWGYYGSVPRRSSFAIQALVVKHFLYGGYYPVGGARRIAETLLGTVAQAGGWTRIAADVAEILIDNGRAVGVRLRSGEELRAQRVISAVGVMSTVSRLLPASYRQEDWARSIARLPPGPAHVCLYIGFKGDIRQAGAGSANQWFYQTWDYNEDAWHIDARGGLPDAPILYTSFPSLKDPTHDPGPEQRHTGEVVTFVPYQTFERFRHLPWRRRGEEYEALKQALTERLLEQLYRYRPGLKPLVDYVELSTPVSTENFCRPMAGSIYGIEPTPERFRNRWLRPASPIRDLYFSGSEVASVGVMGAMMGGVLAAATAEPRAMFGYLRGM